eukprot:6107955-Heterocapsa_arctica.AAC.1
MVRCGPGPRSSEQCRASIYKQWCPQEEAIPQTRLSKPCALRGARTEYTPYAVAGQGPHGHR